MAKAKSYYFCQECGYQSSSWLGRCPECGKFGTFVEEVVKATQTTKYSATQPLGHSSTPQRIQEVKYSETKRLPTHCAEFDRVLGGGIVPGSLLLLGGEPGIGKSTLLLQTALSIHDRKLLYVSGEESEQQIKMRADRLESGRVTESQSGRVATQSDNSATQPLLTYTSSPRPSRSASSSISTPCSPTSSSWTPSRPSPPRTWSRPPAA